MDQWLESVYSDTTAEFVSSPAPKLSETVAVRVRMYAGAPVRHVLLRSLHDGAERIDEARAVKTERGLVYYEAPLAITENRIQYQFYLVCDDVIYFYTQRGITTYVPDHTYDFVLLADYVQPAWVIRQFLGLPDLFLERNEILRSVPYRMTAEDVESRVSQHLSKLPGAIRENQFNLFDSHDVLRLHNYPGITPDVWRGAVIFQFMLPGAASIYYGDEAGIDGRWSGSDAGCRFPMPWSRDITGCEAYRVYSTMAHMKARHRALSHGGMKFLYAKGQVVAMARFRGNEAFVGVISTGDRTETVSIPFGVLGAEGPEGDRDVFGRRLGFSPVGGGRVDLTVEARQSYFFACKMKDP